LPAKLSIVIMLGEEDLVADVIGCDELADVLELAKQFRVSRQPLAGVTIVQT